MNHTRLFEKRSWATATSAFAPDPRLRPKIEYGRQNA